MQKQNPSASPPLERDRHHGHKRESIDPAQCDALASSPQGVLPLLGLAQPAGQVDQQLPGHVRSTFYQRPEIPARDAEGRHRSIHELEKLSVPARFQTNEPDSVSSGPQCGPDRWPFAMSGKRRCTRSNDMRHNAHGREPRRPAHSRARLVRRGAHQTWAQGAPYPARFGYLDAIADPPFNIGPSISDVLSDSKADGAYFGRG